MSPTASPTASPTMTWSPTASPSPTMTPDNRVQDPHTILMMVDCATDWASAGPDEVICFRMNPDFNCTTDAIWEGTLTDYDGSKILKFKKSASAPRRCWKIHTVRMVAHPVIGHNSGGILAYKEPEDDDGISWGHNCSTRDFQTGKGGNICSTSSRDRNRLPQEFCDAETYLNSNTIHNTLLSAIQTDCDADFSQDNDIFGDCTLCSSFGTPGIIVTLESSSDTARESRTYIPGGDDSEITNNHFETNPIPLSLSSQTLTFSLFNNNGTYTPNNRLGIDSTSTETYWFNATFKKSQADATARLMMSHKRDGTTRPVAEALLNDGTEPMTHPFLNDGSDGQGTVAPEAYHIMGGTRNNNSVAGVSFRWQDDGAGSIAGKNLIVSSTEANQNIAVINPSTNSWLPHMDSHNEGSFELTTGPVKIYHDDAWRTLTDKIKFEGAFASIPYHANFWIRNSATSSEEEINGPTAVYQYDLGQLDPSNAEYALTLSYGLQNIGIGKLAFKEKTALSVTIDGTPISSIGRIASETISGTPAEDSDFVWTVLDAGNKYKFDGNETQPHELRVYLPWILQNDDMPSGAGPGDWVVRVVHELYNAVNLTDATKPPGSTVAYTIDTTITFTVPSTYYELGDPLRGQAQSQTGGTRGGRGSRSRRGR